jgi:hypothetical protein
MDMTHPIMVLLIDLTQLVRIMVPEIDMRMLVHITVLKIDMTIGRIVTIGSPCSLGLFDRDSMID